MRYIQIAALVFALVLLSPSVLAYTDASIDIRSRVNATCPCSTLTGDDMNVVVKNLGTSRETYQLYLILPDDDLWSGFISPTITLSPEEEGSAGAVFITPSCTVEPGVYTVGVMVKSTVSDKAFVKEFDLRVLPCHWFVFETGEYDLCQGIDSLFEIGIENEGISDEKVELSASEDWVSFPVSTVEIEKDGEEMVNVLFSPPADEFGLKNVTIMARSLTSYATREKTITANVRECYSADIDIEPSALEVCPCKAARFVLEIRNMGLMEDMYQVTYSNKSSEVTLAPGDGEGVMVSVDIPCDAEGGDYPLEVSIDSHTPEMIEAIIGVKPYDECYAVSMSIDDRSKEVEVGKAVTFTMEIENTGEFEQVYELLVDAPGWVHLSDSQARLAPGEGKDIYLYAAPNYYIQAGSYSAAVSAMSETEQAGLELEIDVQSEFSIEPGEEANETPPAPEEVIVPEPPAPPEEAGEIGEGENITLNISIPTGAVVVGEAADEEDRPWTQIMLLTVLAIGVVFILILRFVIMIK